MRLVEFQSVDPNRLDDYLAKLCAMVKKGQDTRPDYYGMVAAGILTPKGRWVAKLNYPKGKLRVHAERAAIEEYHKYHGDIPKGSIMITTLSPCNEKDDETAEHRVGVSCTDLINQQGFDRVYSGFKDPTQDDEHSKYREVFTKNKQLRDMCGEFADSFLEENFADGKHPEDKGDSKRHHVPTKGSVSSLRKFAKSHSGRAAQLAHWMANMKSGHKK
jgi:pyrimidine deaminase RibD-like protein